MAIDVNKKMQAGAYQSNPGGASQPASQPDLIGIEAAASRLGLSPWTLRRWVCDRKITSCKIGTRRLIPVTEIDRLISAGLEERNL
jgi:excisionase family DNA binding protein